MVKEVKSVQKTELPLEALPSPIITDPWKRRRLLIRFFTRLAGRIVRETGSIPRTIQVLRALRARHHEARAFNLFGKLAEVEGRVFWHLASGGAPSAAAQKVIGQEISRILYPDKPVGLRVLMLAITKKCPLSCEHCYEGDYLQGAEVLNRDDLQEIIRQYQEAGTPVIWLGGGEPMVRIRDVRFLLRHAAPGTDFWIVTSGYRLNEQTAKGLKADGLTGAVVSLDHFDATMHNRFRGSDRAFDWAVQACKSAKKAGLVTAVSICATREFTTEDNFRKYMDLAKQFGVAFVQLLEPKASGRYAGKDVALSKDQVALLERLVVEYNSNPTFATYPIIDYADFLSRRIGCNAAGNRYLYINSNGAVQICPFCHTEVAKALAFSPEDTIRLAGQLRCPEFESATF